MRRRSASRAAGAVTALIVAAAGACALAAPVSAAATVLHVRYDDEFAFAYTDTFSADGCLVVSRSAGTGTTPDGSTTMYYASASSNKCTGEVFYNVWGQGPTQAYDFARTSVHAIATVPLSDGTQIHLDLTWQGTGVIEHSVSTSVNLVPGVSVDRVAIHGTAQQATVSGTQTFENASISASQGSGMLVTIDHP
jgi:hypothetical protein